MEALAELERRQIQLLNRIAKLELSVLPQHHSILSSKPTAPPVDDNEADTEARLSSILLSNGVEDFSFKRVPLDYYDWPLEARRDTLGAASIDHLCKSIVLVNTQAQSDVIDCSDSNNSKYYVVVVQYTARFNAEAVKNFLYSLNNGKIAKKKFNLRLAPEETSTELTGYGHNAVTCIGMKTDIPAMLLRCMTKDPLIFGSVPYVGYMITSSMFKEQKTVDRINGLSQVILDEAIIKLTPDFFWLGGGEVDLKLGIRTSQLIRFIKPFIVSCSNN